jgi:competence protein ComFC
MHLGLQLARFKSHLVWIMSFPGPPVPSFARRVLEPLWGAFVDLIYPRLCSLCQTPVEEGWFCAPCQESLPLVEAPYCSVCGEVYEDGALTRDFRCANCSGRRLEFEFAVAACHSKGTMRELIHAFKYHRRLALRGALASLMLRTLEEPRLAQENLAEWLLVPVPLHRSREQEREFNQSWELCQRLSRLTGIPAAKALMRTRATDSQVRLGREERLKNLRGVFAMKKTRFWQPKLDLQGCRILLVDDVFTTGATTNECARVLRREGGAEKVVVITTTRG